MINTDFFLLNNKNSNIDDGTSCTIDRWCVLFLLWLALFVYDVLHTTNLNCKLAFLMKKNRGCDYD